MNMKITEGIEDKDFNLSQSLASVGVDIKKGDVLFSDCKDVFLDLQRHKNQNNIKVKQMMKDM